MQIKEVSSPSDWKAFHDVPHYIYANDPHWIAPLENDVDDVFSPAKNKTYAQGKSKVWLLYNDSRAIGRIAAFIDGGRNAKMGTKNGGIGFFECPMNQKAADMLFDSAENFLREEGMEVIDGPINFGERDKFWGLLAKGWAEPIYHENYHPAYYKQYFEQRGYQPHEQIFTFHGAMDVVDSKMERGHAIAERVRQRYGIQSRSIRKNDLKNESVYIAEVYNNAFKHMPYFKPLQPKQVYQMFSAMKPVMDENITCIAFADNQPVGFCGLMPELNPLFEFSKGKMKWWKLPRFLYNLHFVRPQYIKGVAFGIHPDFQKRGVFSEMVDFMFHVNDRACPKRYDGIRMSTIRGHNAVMIKTVGAALGVAIERVHMGYRKHLDGSPVEPLPMTDVSDVPMGDVPDISLYPVG